jgi:hypothetical protein
LRRLIRWDRQHQLIRLIRFYRWDLLGRLTLWRRYCR